MQPVFHLSLCASFFNSQRLCCVCHEGAADSEERTDCLCECVCACACFHREGYFYLTCKSLRAEIHRGPCRGRREQQSIFKPRLTLRNPLYAVAAEAAELHPLLARYHEPQLNKTNNNNITSSRPITECPPIAKNNSVKADLFTRCLPLRNESS